MKNLTACLLLVACFLYSSCSKDEAMPFVEFEDLGNGAYARLIDGVNGKYDFFDAANSSINFNVEFVDENNGQNVVSYAWSAQYMDNVTETISDPVPIVTKNKSDFGLSEANLPSASFTFNMTDILSKLDKTDADINGGDGILFSAIITKEDGSTFRKENTGNNIISSSPFSGWFEFTQPIVCPSSLEGICTYKTVGWCGEEYTGEVEIATTSKVGIYNVLKPGNDDPEFGDFSFGAYYACYGSEATFPGGTLQIQDACNKISPIGVSRWAETYWYNDVSVDGVELTIDWENDYDQERGTTILTRQDGRDWPSLTN